MQQTFAIYIRQNTKTKPNCKVDINYILREIAASMDLDEDKILNDPREAALQAKMMAGNPSYVATADPRRSCGSGGRS